MQTWQCIRATDCMNTYTGEGSDLRANVQPVRIQRDCMVIGGVEWGLVCWDGDGVGRYIGGCPLDKPDTRWPLCCTRWR